MSIRWRMSDCLMCTVHRIFRGRCTLARLGSRPCGALSPSLMCCAMQCIIPRTHVLRPWPGMRGDKHRCSTTPRRMCNCLMCTHTESQYAASTHLSPYRRRMCNSNICTLPVSRCNIHIGPRRSTNPAPFYQSCKITVFFFGAGVLDANPAKIHHFPRSPHYPPVFSPN